MIVQRIQRWLIKRTEQPTLSWTVLLNDYLKIRLDKKVQNLTIKVTVNWLSILIRLPMRRIKISFNYIGPDVNSFL